MSVFKKVILMPVLVATLFGMLFACLAGCSSKGQGRGLKLKEWMQDSEKRRILCTTAQIGDIVSSVGGTRVKTWVLIQGDLDPHSYELVKGDDEKLSRADIIYYNGLNLEHGASLASFLKESPHTVAVGDKIAETHPDVVLKRGDVVDPHIWMDVSVWKLTIEPVLEALCRIDPEGAFYYSENAKALSQEMEVLHRKICDRLHEVPESKRYLLTSHDAFRYFARSYLAEEGEENWHKRFAAPEGLAPDGQISPVDIQRMVDYLKNHRICVLFPESNISRDSIRKIAVSGQELGLELRICNETLYGDSTSGHTYFEMMEKNADVISRYLK